MSANRNNCQKKKQTYSCCLMTSEMMEVLPCELYGVFGRCRIRPLSRFVACILHFSIKRAPHQLPSEKSFFNMISSLQLEEKPKNLGKADDDLKISSHSSSTLTRVAEVARARERRSPKSLDSDESFKP